MPNEHLEKKVSCKLESKNQESLVRYELGKQDSIGVVLV